MTVRRPLAIAAAVLALAGCTQASDTSESPSKSPGTADSALIADHNEADVAFTSGMIPHHSQALMMVQMAEGRPQSAAFRELLGNIHDAQAPEIEQMSSWLLEWGEPVPEHANDMSDMSSMHMGDGMEGMLTGEQMMSLNATPDAGFETAWLKAMIKHHRGAIAMAEGVLANGQHDGVRALAQSIADSQSAEIVHMQEMLAR